jgi:hypothetical protein
MSRLRSLRILPDRSVELPLLVIGAPGAVVLAVGITFVLPVLVVETEVALLVLPRGAVETAELIVAAVGLWRVRGEGDGREPVEAEDQGCQGDGYW